MASPQKENGYTAISNETMEALAGIRISGEANQCLFVILRKTYGWNKKEDKISLSQFCLLTKMVKPRICHALLKLAKMNLIIAKKGNDTTTLYRFNKDFETWKPLPKKVIIAKNGNGVAKKGNDHCQKRQQSLPKIGHTKTNKETITKDTITKDIRPSDDGVNKIIGLFKKINPVINFGNTTTRKATSDLIGQFGLDRTIKIAEFAISVQGRQFAPVITTPYQLKEKFSQLNIYYQKENNKPLATKNYD